MNWSLLFVVISALCGTLDASVSQTFISEITHPIAFSLDDFQNGMLTFLDSMLPTSVDFSNDLTDKVNEFSKMQDPEEFPSLGALYGQYIQLYSIWKLAYDTQARTYQNLNAAAPGKEPTILFFKDDLESVLDALHMFSAGATQSLLGVLQYIREIPKAVKSKGYSIKDGQIQMQTKHAYKIFEAMTIINDGNQQSITAAEGLVTVANTSMHYQKNSQAKQYLTNLMTFKQTLLTYLKKISDLEQSTNIEFFDPNSQLYTMYTAAVSTIYGCINNEQTKIAKYFMEIVAAGNKLTAQIVGAPSSSM